MHLDECIEIATFCVCAQVLAEYLLLRTFKSFKKNHNSFDQDVEIPLVNFKNAL